MLLIFNTSIFKCFKFQKLKIWTFLILNLLNSFASKVDPSNFELFNFESSSFLTHQISNASSFKNLKIPMLKILNVINFQCFQFKRSNFQKLHSLNASNFKCRKFRTLLISNVSKLQRSQFLTL